ncbi:MAG: CYTH domain-containing protein [Planctomycetota bacterium]|jgi:inorganic triphosphatase YgiF
MAEPGDTTGTEIERELKFAVADGDALERVADELRAAPPVAQTNIFFDTGDGTLAAARHGLRLRLQPPAAEITLKGPNTGAPGAAVRSELGAPVDWASAVAVADGQGRIDALAGPPLEAARRLAGGAPLAERMRFRNDRRIAWVTIAGERCEVACDTTTFPDDSVEYEIEVEVPDDATLAAARPWLEALLARLDVAAEPQRRGKANRAARKAGLR